MASYPEETKAQARKMVEESGLSAAEAGRNLGISESTVTRWALREKWARPAAISRPGATSQDIPSGTAVSPVLAVLKKLEDLESVPIASRDTRYDERLRLVAHYIPEVILQLHPSEWLRMADKIAKLVDTSRRILGKDKDDDKGKGAISLGVLVNVQGSSIPEPHPKTLELNALGNTAQKDS